MGDSHSTGCTMRMKNYLNNKFEVNDLVKLETGVDILVNSARKDIVNLTICELIIFLVVPVMWERTMLRWP